MNEGMRGIAPGRSRLIRANRNSDRPGAPDAARGPFAASARWLRRAIGQDAEDAATADAERAAENTSREHGPNVAARAERRRARMTRERADRCRATESG